ncbi:ABC transporter ATP-binding protein [Ferrimicrobium sp.]|uniref:ABC transporter ATP-binding protein n=1 Tax=Ferrimicrobium sp. TaxID=2926050 RepID=UPI00261EF448|nr:ABC transporter ATP-binding protein [Ferrimicrobium sp.]
MIEVQALSKTYGRTKAVDDVSFDVVEGRVTGFLGPNGAGKSTTMRMIMGLDHPTSGTVRINNSRYSDLRQPLRTVGALLEAKAFHPGRSARNYLKALAVSNRIPISRVDEVLDIVGLTSVANRRTKSLSLGMGQRLGIAAALIGDPQILLFDEPTNGLDPEGILWVRKLLRGFASEGRTVFVSSHLMGEMALTADHLVVIGKGRLIADAEMNAFIAGSSKQTTLVRTPQAEVFAATLAGRGGTVSTEPDGSLLVDALTTAEIGEAAASTGVILHELTPQVVSLEEAFMEMTQADVEFRATPKEASLIGK